MKSATKRRGLTAAVMMVTLGACARAATPLPELDIDPARVTVSGISSGAFMAQQVHFAYSDRIAGAAYIAGGPYGCAEGKLEIALGPCMGAKAGGPDVDLLANVIEQRAKDGAIAPLRGLANDAVWVFRGTLDPLVAAPVTEASAAIYDAVGSKANVTRDFARAMSHTFPTEKHGVACDKLEAPFLGACAFDAAGEILKQVAGAKGDAPVTATGEIVAFDQTAFVAEGSDPLLAAEGFVYVPKACSGAACGLHIVFHGCEQNAEKIGREFVEHAGYNRWADAANVVVVYPQTRSSLMPLNPKACWDWWGYTGAGYDTLKGPQIRWVGHLLDALTAKK